MFLSNFFYLSEIFFKGGKCNFRVSKFQFGLNILCFAYLQLVSFIAYYLRELLRKQKFKMIFEKTKRENCMYKGELLSPQAVISLELDK